MRVVTVTFEEHEGKVKLRHIGIPAGENRKLAEQGWNESFDKFAESLKGGNYMQKITPFLWFDNQAEEAANFYTSIFKNSKIGNITRYGKEGYEIHGRGLRTRMACSEHPRLSMEKTKVTDAAGVTHLTFRVIK